MNHQEEAIQYARHIVVAPIECPEDADGATWQVYAQGDDVSDTTWLMDFNDSESAMEFGLEILGSSDRRLSAFTMTFED